METDSQNYIVLIIYDISENKQRLKMAKFLSQFGKRVQKSAFEASLSVKQYNTMIKGLSRRVKKEDNVRVYKLYSLSAVKVYGQAEYENYEDVILI